MDEQPKRTRWLWAGVCALALTAAMSVASILGWTEGFVGRGLLVASVLVTLAIALFGNHMPSATRRQGLLAGLMVVAIFACVLGVSWLWGRSSPVAAELEPPPQRTVADLRSKCEVPALAELAGEGSARIQSTRVAAQTTTESDFISALVAKAAGTAFPDEVLLTVLECNGTTWHRTLSEPVSLSGCEYGLSTTQLRNEDHEEVLFTRTCGSGSYLDFRLLGADTGSVRTLYSEDGLFQGQASQVRDRLVVVGGSERTELTWDGEQFKRTGRVSSLPAAEGVIVEFWWGPDRGGETDLEDVSVRVKERVYFQWNRHRNTDESVTSYRILASIPPCPRGSGRCPARFAEDGRGERYLVLNDEGLAVDVTIVPNGYNWERAITVTVRS